MFLKSVASGLRRHRAASVANMAAAYCFGRFELKAATRQLLVEGRPAAVGSRAFDVLLALIERRERLVTKDELLDLAWPGLVVEENNLHVQISSLRKIVGDGIIETVPGHGYRFAAEIVSSEHTKPSERRDNLPRPLTRFIGHENDREKYAKLIDSNRLVTLTGVGGCGKTRLAVELAHQLLPMFAHGSWFVGLAPIADAERLALTVARTLGLTERPGQPVVETLCAHLAARQMLLVLDNCEHLIEGCADFVATMLGRASELHVLATSREALGLPGEQTLRVRSLSCPPAEQGSGGNDFQTFEAVQLFVDRARLMQPDFTVDATTAPAVCEVCRRLDGIPLAIELAAARTKVCSVRELRKMLDDRFRLLVGGSRMAPPRQQTLLATIKWSFDLLRPDERGLLEHLSVFVGGWTLESAVAVAGEAAEQYKVLEELAHLVDKSLIATHHSETGPTRYSMLETVRQYGVEALAAAGAETATAIRHLEYFVALAERLKPAFMTSGEREALDQLAPELDNIVQALRGCERLPSGTQLGLRLVAALGQYWLSLGLIELGYRLTNEVLAMQGAQAPSAARLHALFEAERFLNFLGRVGEARDRATECLSLARALHDDHVTGGVLAHLGGQFVKLGDAAQGVALIEESVRLARERSDQVQICRALCILGEARCALGNFELGSSILEEGLQIARDQRDPHSAANLACMLARACISFGHVQRAEPLVLEALDLSDEVKSRMTMQLVLDAVTALAAAAMDWPAAARMLGAADSALKLVGLQRFYMDTQFWPSIIAAVKNAFGGADFEAAYDAGQALTIEQAGHEARAWLETLPPTAPRVVVEFRRRAPGGVRR